VVAEPLPADSDTIMFSTTKHRDRTCLTDDDLEGLNFLYPSCAGALETPLCDVAKRGTGYLRLAIAVGFPYVLVTMILFCTQCCVRSYQQRQLKKLENAVQSLRIDRQALRHRLAGVPRIMSRSRSGGMVSGASRDTRTARVASLRRALLTRHPVLSAGLISGLDNIMHGRMPGMTPRGGRGTSPDDRTPRGTHWRTPRRAMSRGFSGRFTGRSGRMQAPASLIWPWRPPDVRRSATRCSALMCDATLCSALLRSPQVPQVAHTSSSQEEEMQVAAALEASRLSAVNEAGRERGWSVQEGNGRGPSASGGSLPPTADALRSMGMVPEQDDFGRNQSLGSISIDSRGGSGPLEIGGDSVSTSAIPIAVSSSPVPEGSYPTMPPSYSDPHMASVGRHQEV
jgi:hypothetical protein